MSHPTIPARGRLLRTEDVAELLDVTVRTLERWRRDGAGPPYVAFGGTIRYHPARVSAWVASHEQGTPSQNRGTPSRKGTPRRKVTPDGR